jgi:hypothetical protein
MEVDLFETYTRTKRIDDVVAQLGVLDAALARAPAIPAGRARPGTSLRRLPVWR